MTELLAKTHKEYFQYSLSRCVFSFFTVLFAVRKMFRLCSWSSPNLENYCHRLDYLHPHVSKYRVSMLCKTWVTYSLSQFITIVCMLFKFFPVSFLVRGYKLLCIHAWVIEDTGIYYGVQCIEFDIYLQLFALYHLLRFRTTNQSFKQQKLVNELLSVQKKIEMVLRQVVSDIKSLKTVLICNDNDNY